ncbi:MAG: hypothetical protein RLZ72_1096 [Actinomycetota bacterium]
MAATELRLPTESDDKYSRGVLGFATGSVAFPGAAMLGIDAALSTGIGMVRYVGEDSVANAVVARRPEVVKGPGRVSAWVVGSGMVAVDDDAMLWARAALSEGITAIVDAGALSLLPIHPRVIATPHAGELATALRITRSDVEADPAALALRAAIQWDVTVVLKGSTTYIVNPLGDAFSVNLAPAWLAIAGAGDTLAGIIGALAATRSDDIAESGHALARIAAAGVVVHSVAAARASGGGPFLLADLVKHIPGVIRDLALQS